MHKYVRAFALFSTGISYLFNLNELSYKGWSQCNESAVNYIAVGIAVFG